MRIAITAFIALFGSLALLNVLTVSDHRDLNRNKGCAFGMPGMPGQVHYSLKADEDLHIDKAQLVAINAQLPIVVNKRTSLSMEGQFVRPEKKTIPIVKVHNIIMQ